MQVLPGKRLGEEAEYIPGVGVHIRDGGLFSSVMGTVKIEQSAGETSQPKSRINVIASKDNSQTVISVGDVVICQVIRIMMSQINVEILAVGDKELRQSTRGIVRKEDVRESEIDKVVMSECFRVGDLVRAKVISLGDSKQYYLSCAQLHLGVFVAKHEKSDRFLVPVNWNEMEDPVTKEKETRKVAKPLETVE